MYSAFVLIPQFVQVPESSRLRLRRVGHRRPGSSCCRRRSRCCSSGPSPAGSRARSARRCRSCSARRSIGARRSCVLAVEHSEQWQVYVASLLLGIGIGFAFASHGEPDRRGRAAATRPASRPGMNTIIRTIGGAIGAPGRGQHPRRRACSPTATRRRTATRSRSR